MMPTARARDVCHFLGHPGIRIDPGKDDGEVRRQYSLCDDQDPGTRIVLDAGTGIRNLGIEMVRESETQGPRLALHLFLSHTHWDHIQGLPFFQPAYENNTKLTIYGSPTEGWFSGFCLEASDGLRVFSCFHVRSEADIRIKEMSEEASTSVPSGWSGRSRLSPGRIGEVSFHINGKSIVYATDVELDRIFQADTAQKTRKSWLRSTSILFKGLIFSLPTASLLRGVPVQSRMGSFLHFCRFGAATKADVEQLAIFHHDPQHSDKMLDDLWMKSRIRYGERCQDGPLLGKRGLDSGHLIASGRSLPETTILFWIFLENFDLLSEAIVNVLLV